MNLNTIKRVLSSRCCKVSAIVAVAALALVSASAFAATTGDVPSSFSQLTTNVSNLELQILKIVQVVVTLAGILLVFRGVVHLKQNSHGSPQEKHLPKGIANIVFAAILFMVVPLLHMFVGTLSSGIAGGNASFNQWTTGTAGYAQGLTDGS